MEEIQQFLGHSDINVTRKIYARFSPSYLKDAAAALEMDDLGPVDQGARPKKRLSPLKSLPNMVAEAVEIEPVSKGNFAGNREKYREFSKSAPK
jgi:hypothetical protein